MSKTQWGPLDPTIAKLCQGKPRDVHGQESIETVKYINRLTRYLLAPLYIENWPEEWDWNYCIKSLMLYGKLQTTDTEIGVVTLPANLYGVNVYKQPTRAISANTVLGNIERTINVDCTIWRILYDYSGLYDMLQKYAYKLAGIDASFDINIINTRTPFFCNAESKAEAANIRTALGKYYEGEPYVIATQSALKNIIPHNVTNTFIADKLQIAKQNVINEFLTEIGINNSNREKRERMITDEANANNEQIIFSIQDVLNNLYYSIKRANDMFGYSMVGYWKGQVIRPYEPMELSGMEPGNLGRSGDAGGDVQADPGSGRAESS